MLYFIDLTHFILWFKDFKLARFTNPFLFVEIWKKNSFPWMICQLFNQWNAKKRFLDFLLLIHTPTILFFFFFSLIWLFQWIPGFLLTIIRNPGIIIIRVRVAFQLFQINWNQHKSNIWKKEIQCEPYLHSI